MSEFSRFFFNNCGSPKVVSNWGANLLPNVSYLVYKQVFTIIETMNIINGKAGKPRNVFDKNRGPAIAVDWPPTLFVDVT